MVKNWSLLGSTAFHYDNYESGLPKPRDSVSPQISLSFGPSQHEMTGGEVNGKFTALKPPKNPEQ